MTPYDQFQKNIEAASHYRKMYRELRSLKNLGAKGKLSAENQYLMWLPRAMVVASLSALDAYVHQVLYDKIPRILVDENQRIPGRLAELIIDAVPMKKAMKWKLRCDSSGRKMDRKSWQTSFEKDDCSSSLIKRPTRSYRHSR